MTMLSMNETTTFRWSFEEDVENYSKGGICAIGVWRDKLSDCGLAKAVETLQRFRMQVSHLFWVGGFTGSDGRTFRESVDDAAEAIKTAAAIGAQTLLVHSGPRAGHTANHARRLFQSALKELLPQAAESAVVLAVEPMHPGCAAEWTFLTSLDETLALVATAGSPNLKIVLDTYHLGLDPEFVAKIPQLTPHVALVQLGDGRRPPNGEQNRCKLGEGIVPLGDIVAALKASGYAGYYDVELLGEEVEPADYHAMVKHARQAFDALIAG